MSGSACAENTSFVVRTLHVRSRANDDAFYVNVKISQPRWVEEGVEANCEVTIDPLYGRQPLISGIDPFDALKNAMLLIEQLLIGASEGYEMFWPNAEPYEP